MTSLGNGSGAYYNEIDKYCADWLRSLIRAGLIAPGDVDERDIREVHADDIRRYTQCHFFAGIGGWSRALRLASWEDSRPAWTGSCPCQPFSSAGKRQGKADERHLWPVWFGLIRECRPSSVFGEQVAAAIAHGWLDEAAHDLEAEGYAVGASVLPACSVGQPHRRDRLWFVADAEGARVRGKQRDVHEANGRQDAERLLQLGSASESAVGDPELPEGSRHRQHGREVLPKQEAELARKGSFPNDLVWLAGPDGKSRPVKPGIRLLADGVPARVGKLRAYGNAIVPQVAAEFIRAARAYGEEKS